MSKTPRTDALLAGRSAAWANTDPVVALARQLERELGEDAKRWQESFFALVMERDALRRGYCPKCGIGAMRETCAYPEACEHPARELAMAYNRLLITTFAKQK